MLVATWSKLKAQVSKLKRNLKYQSHGLAAPPAELLPAAQWSFPSTSRFQMLMKTLARWRGLARTICFTLTPALSHPMGEGEPPLPC
jgi:hypothetical protein